MRAEERRKKEIEILKKSPVALTAADIAKIFGVSKPTAGKDLDFILANNLVSKLKIRRHWNISEIVGLSNR